MLHFPDRFQLGLRQQVPAGIVDTCQPGNCFRGRDIVAGQHYWSHAQRFKVNDSLLGRFLDRVSDSEYGQYPFVVGKQRYRAALLFMDGQLSLQLRATKPLFVNEPMVTQNQALAIDQPFNTPAWQGLKAVNLGCLQTQPKRNCL